MVNKSRGLDPPVSTAMRRLSYLRGVLATRIFHLVEDFSGVTEVQLAVFTGENARRTEAALAQLAIGGLLIRCPVYRLPDDELTSDIEIWKVRIAQLLPDQVGKEPEPAFHMHYLSDEGTIIVEHRDQSSLSRIRRRVHEDIRKDHAGDRHQLLHTLQLNDCNAALTAAGYEVCAGYRACLYLPGNRQLVPDAYMEGLWDLGERAVEEVRGNPWDQAFRRRVREQLQKYVPTARSLSGLQVTYVCESERVRSIVLEEAAKLCREHRVNLQAMPVLDAKVRVGPAREGMPEVWRPLYIPINWYIEYERSAVERPNVREKLMPLVRVAQAGQSCAVIFICETQVAEERFQEEHQRLQRAHQVSFPLITSTHERVTKHTRGGTPWSMNGQPVRLV